MNNKALIFLVFICALGACSSDEQSITHSEPEDESEILTKSIKYLALGDSYTIGEGVQDLKRWPNQLVEEFESNDLSVDKLDIIAKTGWRTSDLINAIETNNPKDFNLISLQIGVNNQFSNQDFETFVEEFDLLIQKSTQIAGQNNRVFVVSIPDYGVTPFGNSWGNPEQIASEIDMYNNYISQKCSEVGIAFINITDISRSLGDSEGALAPDNLHPSGFQYGLWVEKILPVVLEMISE
ncbi:MAG: SGNH/GDSL hydrolase family protein [Bacteroidetes bacterium]|jgi:lysophospholipase L1-like esterase|nr:SGNH/GDSL hydrolase family protein [Bacteroidota bacterium]